MHAEALSSLPDLAACIGPLDCEFEGYPGGDGQGRSTHTPPAMPPASRLFVMLDHDSDRSSCPTSAGFSDLLGPVLLMLQSSAWPRVADAAA